MPTKINYSKLPSHIQDGVKRYIEHGVEPGDFLTAVICNDLKESFGRADETNIAQMFDIVGFFYNEAPAGCWGSKEKMMNWIKEDGLCGIEDKRIRQSFVKGIVSDSSSVDE